LYTMAYTLRLTPSPVPNLPDVSAAQQGNVLGETLIASFLTRGVKSARELDLSPRGDGRNPASPRPGGHIQG